MATAYVPGLIVSERKVVFQERRLPLKGQILVKKGDRVTSHQIVARTELPGKVQLVNVANQLALSPDEVKDCMKKSVGDAIKKGELLAESPGIFGFFKTPIEAPVTGTVESVSDITGQVVLRQNPIPVEVDAYIDGIIDEILPEEGVVIRSDAVFIQGIFGVGGEVTGEIKMIAQTVNDVLDEKQITDDCKGKIIVGGSRVTAAAMQKAVKIGAKGIIAGGIDDADLKGFLGYDLGVAITGHENKGITLVVTEGFGTIKMAAKTFELLQKNEGKKASINGATQIRAGVIRPEVVITYDTHEDVKVEEKEVMGMVKGCPVRVIREPLFGQIAVVKSLPVKLHKVESETMVRVVEIELPDKSTFLLPRANVELIE